MKIQVTKEDIEKGARYMCRACPIALATLRTGVFSAVVYQDSISISFSGEGFKYFSLPENAIDFIKSFDSHQPVKPFSFELRGIKLTEEKL